MPTPEIRALFQPDFALSYTVALHKTGALETTLKVINPSSTDTLRFQSLLHTYLRLPEGLQPSETKVQGLGNLQYADKPSGGAIKTQSDADIVFQDEVDRVYYDAPNSATLVNANDGSKIIEVQKNNYESVSTRSTSFVPF